MWHLIALGIIAAWVLGGVVSLAPPFLTAIGWLGLCFFLYHVAEEGQGTVNMHRKLAAYLYPFLLATAIFIIGMWNQPVAEIERAGVTYFALQATSPLMPATTLPASGWLPLVMGGALYMATLNVLLVIKAEDVVRRILLVLGISAAVLALLGLFQAMLQLERLAGVIRVPTGTYFSLFPHPHGWASFGLLWTGAMIGLGSHFIRHMRLPIFLERGGIWFILATIILAASVVLTGTAFHVFFIFLLLAIAALDVAHFMTAKKKLLKGGFWLAGMAMIVIGVLLLAVNVQSATRSVVDTSVFPAAGLDWQEQSLLYRESWKLFLEKPLFGWGPGSFRPVLALHQSADLGNNAYAAAHADLLQSLVENGLLVTLAWISVPVIIFVRFLRLKSHRPLSWYLFATCAMGLLLALVGFPFRYPAFLFSFWLLWFIAHRWSVIPHLHTTDIARPVLVFTEEERQQTASPLGRYRHRRKHRKKR